MLGIIGAMDEEVAQIKEKMTDVTVTSVAGMDFYQGKLGGKDAVVVRSGIGKVNAGMCSQILADRFHISAIVNTGIAGSLRAEINIGDIVVSTDAVQHDMDASGFGYRIGQIPRVDTFAFEADEKLRELAIECNQKVNPEIQAFPGRVVSGDQFISDKAKKEWLIEQFSASCTEMVVRQNAVAFTAPAHGRETCPFPVGTAARRFCGAVPLLSTPPAWISWQACPSAFRRPAGRFPAAMPSG